MDLERYQVLFEDHLIFKGPSKADTFSRLSAAEKKLRLEADARRDRLLAEYTNLPGLVKEYSEALAKWEEAIEKDYKNHYGSGDMDHPSVCFKIKVSPYPFPSFLKDYLTSDEIYDIFYQHLEDTFDWYVHALIEDYPIVYAPPDKDRWKGPHREGRSGGYVVIPLATGIYWDDAVHLEDVLHEYLSDGVPDGGTRDLDLDMEEADVIIKRIDSCLKGIKELELYTARVRAGCEQDMQSEEWWREYLENRDIKPKEKDEEDAE